MKTCPECGGTIKEWDEAIYTQEGEVDQVIHRTCQKCGVEW